MFKPWKEPHTLLLAILCQLVVHSIAEKSMINDDDYLGSINDDNDLMTKDAYMSEAVRRGLESMISDSPYHRSKIQTQALIDKIGELLFHPPVKHDPDIEDISKKNSVDDYFVTVERKKMVKSDKDMIASRKDTVDKRRESIGNLLHNKEETRKDNNKEASFSKKKEVIVNEQGKKSKTVKGDIDVSVANKEDIESENPVNETKRRDMFSSTPPFEGYMRKLALDVNGVMGDATEMLRDTGKLIKGLKRVVKGASTLSSITNHAVKYAKFFSTEPENVTVDFLEEKAIIALLDAQKAANESTKAANLARIASAKAVDVERRVEIAEPDLQDMNLVRPYIEATEILAGKAEKAAKLAKIEKQKTEKDFILMNEELKRLNLKRRPEPLQNSSSYPEKTYFYKKQKELENELLDENAEIEAFKKSIKVNQYSDFRLHAKPSKHVIGVKKSIWPLKKGENSGKVVTLPKSVVTDLGKDVISSIATELTKTIVQSPSTTQYPVPVSLTSKKDITYKSFKKHDKDSRKYISTDVGDEKTISANVGKDDSSATDSNKVVNLLDTSNGENEEKESANEEKSQRESKPDAEQNFGAILRDSIENRDKIMSYLNNQFSPKVALSEVSLPELKVNTEENAKATGPTTEDAERKSNVASQETKEEPVQDTPDKRVTEELKNDLGSLAKEERNVILDYLDQDDSSGDPFGSQERTVYKNDLSHDNSVMGKDKFHSENAVDRSKIPLKMLKNDSMLLRSEMPVDRSKVPLKIPHNRSLNIHQENAMDRSKIPIRIPANESMVPRRTPLNNSFISPAPNDSLLDSNKDTVGNKKSAIEDPYDTIDPFGFKKFEELTDRAV